MACSSAMELASRNRKMPRSRTWLKTECEDAATTTHVTHHCVVSKIVWTCCFTNCVLFFTIIEGTTWGTRHTILLRNVGRKNDVWLAPFKKKRFHIGEKQEIVNSLHTTCAQEKKESKHALVSQTNASIVVNQDRWEWLPHRVRLVICLIIERRMVHTNTQNGQQISHAKWWTLRFSRLVKPHH